MNEWKNKWGQKQTLTNKWKNEKTNKHKQTDNRQTQVKL